MLTWLLTATWSKKSCQHVGWRKLTEGDIWLTFDNFRGVFEVLQNSKKFLTKVTISEDNWLFTFLLSLSFYFLWLYNFVLYHKGKTKEHKGKKSTNNNNLTIFQIRTLVFWHSIHCSVPFELLEKMKFKFLLWKSAMKF